jgi:hypothetical protein
LLRVGFSGPVSSTYIVLRLNPKVNLAQMPVFYGFPALAPTLENSGR